MGIEAITFFANILIPGKLLRSFTHKNQINVMALDFKRYFCGYNFSIWADKPRDFVI